MHDDHESKISAASGKIAETLQILDGLHDGGPECIPWAINALEEAKRHLDQTPSSETAKENTTQTHRIPRISPEDIKEESISRLPISDKTGRIGRPNLIPPTGFREVYNLWANRDITTEAAAKLLHVSRPTFKKWVDATKAREKRHELKTPVPEFI